jgi:hypothetical protein
MLHDLLFRRRNLAQYFDQVWRIFQWSSVSEFSILVSSPIQPLAKSTLCASDCFHGTFCQSFPVQLLCYNYLRCKIETIKYLWTTQIFYANFLGVSTAIYMIVICLASDIKYLQTCGAYLKNHVTHTLIEGTTSFWNISYENCYKF